MGRVFLALVACGVLVSAISILPGCATSSESAERDALTAQVGVYPAPPSGIEKPRVGIPQFQVTGEGSSERLNSIAGDELTTLAGLTDRFDVIERAQLDQLLKEQSLEGIVKGSELAKQAQVRGVDYLLFGKVTNLRVKAEKASRGFGLGQIPIPGAQSSMGVFDYKNKSSKITTECGVDLRLVDPSTGKVVAPHFGEFKRTDTIEAIGVDVLGASAEADADLEISEDDKGKILRLAIDDALRKMLPRIDKALVERTKEIKKAGAAAAPPTASTSVAPESAPPTTAPKEQAPAAAKFCAGCGAKLESGAKFCPGCGQKVSS